MNKTNDEPINPHVLPRKLAIVTCHRCGVMGHTKQSCKGKRVVDRVIPKGGNQTKKKLDGNTDGDKNKKAKRTLLEKRTRSLSKI